MAKIHFIYLDINTGVFPGVNHGLASLAGVLRADGHLVSLHHVLSQEPAPTVAKVAAQSKADIIGFSFTTNQKQYVAKYAEAISKEYKAIQIAGGIHPTIAPMETLKIRPIQGVCIGEGEFSLRELLRCLDSKEDIRKVKGFWWGLPEGNIIRNPVPPLEPKVDSFPFPDYSVFDTESISSASSGWIAILLTRGCPYNCNYCCNHALRGVYPNRKDYVRMPTPAHAINIIKNNLEYYKHVTGINFADDLLIFREQWFEDFAGFYHKEIGLPYTCNGRIDHCSPRTLTNLKRSGCKMVYVGIESGNEWIRQTLLNRHHTNKEILDCFKRISEHRLYTFAYNIVGFPFETRQQMKETLLLNKEARPNSGAVFYFYPYPATRLFDICREFKLLSDKMEELSGYLENPAIKLTHCKKEDCITEYNRLRLFLASRDVMNGLALPEIMGQLFYWIFNISPNFFVKLMTKNSDFKYKIRKLFYRYRFR